MSPFAVFTHTLHLAATCTSLGGLAYARLVLSPNLKALPEAERAPFLKAMLRRYAYIKWSGVLTVAITGCVQWLNVFPTVADRSAYLLAFAVKMVGAVGLFGVTAALALSDLGVGKLNERRALWSGVNIAFGLLILAGAAAMRSIRS
ncbi:MAG TPA: hypothetical protein VHM70_08295 [Polyangiaceae bacterium]|jgi:uncharacterized membrane protein|nr:hypothetical protein [Polyangiaceae bacterium]